MSSDLFPYFYFALALPIGLGWAALQDTVIKADTVERRARARLAAQAVVVAAAVHPALALAGLDMVRQVSKADWCLEPGAASAIRRVRVGVAASFVIAFVAAGLWVLR